MKLKKGDRVCFRNARGIEFDGTVEWLSETHVSIGVRGFPEAEPGVLFVVPRSSVLQKYYDSPRDRWEELLDE